MNILNIMAENYLNMIDLVLTHLNQPWGNKVTVAQVKMLAAALARHTGQEEGEAQRHLFQRLSLGLMRGNATMLVCRGPDGDHPAGEVDGIA